MSIQRPSTPPTARPGPLSRRRLLQGSAALAAGAAGAGTLASCGGAQAPAGATEIDYWLWDALQLPAYSAAIDLFMEQNPDIFVRVTQLGWGDYWTKLTASFVAEAGPDAFADHLARFPEFVSLGVVAPLDGLGPLDDVPAEQFQEGLQQLWTGEDGNERNDDNCGGDGPPVTKYSCRHGFLSCWWRPPKQWPPPSHD